MLDCIFFDVNFLKNIMFSDEATFHMSGKVHRHNVLIRGTENPYVVREHIRDSLKANVWCGVIHDQVTGPFFFQEQAINMNTYLNRLQLYTVPQIEHTSFCNKMVLRLIGVCRYARS
jgi:hypothetical protein